MPRSRLWIAGVVFASLAAAAPNLIYQAGWTPVRGKSSVDASVAHAGKPSVRVESDGGEASIQSAPVPLTIGKRYEVSGWVRTDRLAVRDSGRSPIATGAALSMASMPFDVHSQSLGGTRDWTRVSLKFTATRAQDHIVLAAGTGAGFTGRAWFEGVTLEEISTNGQWPSRAAVKTFGPAYRYPTGGWIYLHIEGEPYERGYQHGYLMAHEIERYIDRCAAQLDSKSRKQAWFTGRTTANALFLRGFDQEILQEMKGIAEGAAAAGAKWDGRPVDLDDIVAANTVTELGLLRAAMPMTPNGLEGLRLKRPDYFDPKRDVAVTDRCSAFAATGPATKDGKMVIAHLTMWSLTLAEQTNVMLDIKPVKGHRMLIQSYPGGIQSGTDWYQNDAGVVLTETTIRQSPFRVEGTPVAYRARKAIQYGTNVDLVVENLSQRNNGLYTNEWIIGDAKTNEVAMLELGTDKTRLYRSSRDDWFTGTKGFYWGCNNAKDLSVRLEYAPDPQGRPQHIPYVPAARDIKWQELYQQHKGNIDEQFAFLAMRTAPLVSPTTMDAKVTTADMASRMMVWAVFGKPNQREWVPTDRQRQQYEGNLGIYSSGYRLIEGQANDSLRQVVRENEQARLAGKPKPKMEKPKAQSHKDKLWKGWILPVSDADIWLTAGAEAYYEDLGSKDFEEALEARRTLYRGAAATSDAPLSSIAVTTTSSQWFRLAEHKGALLLDALRREMTDEKFFPAMEAFFSANTTKKVTAAAFGQAMEQAGGKPLQPFFRRWLNATGLPGDPGGPRYAVMNLAARLSNAVLVYGTVVDAGANRYTAEQVRRAFLNWHEDAIPILRDFEVTAEGLRDREVIFIGRPESNSALAAWTDQIGLHYDDAVFEIGGTTYASEGDALIFAAANPLDPKHMVIVMAGNSALETTRLAATSPGSFPYAVFREGTRVANRSAR